MHGQQHSDSGDAGAQSSDEGTRITKDEFSELAEDAVSIEEEPPPDAPSPGEEIAPVVPDSPAPAAPEPGRPRIFWNQGLRIEQRDDRWRLKIGGRLLLDVAAAEGDSGIDARFDPDTDSEVRQARIDFTGTIGDRIFFKAQLDVSNQDSGTSNRDNVVNDFFIGVKGLGPLGTGKIGVIREPFSLDALTSGINITFLERAVPDAFAPGFNPGVMFESQAFEGAVTWQAGAFRYVGDESDQNRYDLASRVTGVLWSAEEDTRLLHAGAAYTYRTGDFELRLRQRPEVHLASRWVDTGEFDADDAHLFGLEGAALVGRTSLQSELTFTRVNAESGSKLDFWGGYMQISHFLSSDRKPYLRRQGILGRVSPAQPFKWKQRVWGAWEVAGRYSYLDLDDEEIRGGTLQDVTLGLNWYPTAHLRVMFNYVRAHLNNVGTANSLAMRFQVVY